MAFTVPITDAEKDFPQYTFIKALTPSEQKAAFHVKDAAGEDLCLKIIAPNYSVDRIQREIHALQVLAHPNVARLKEYTYSSTPTKQTHFIVEEYIEGHDLSDLLNPGNIWSRQKVSDFFVQFCDGLDALFEKRIVHRDLKPSNIRIRPGEIPVIIDFGLARHLDLDDITLTKEGAAFGTPIYFAPEQFVGTKRDIDHRTDIFATGILMYQALTGKHPFYRNQKTWNELSDAFCNSIDFLSEPEFDSLPREWKVLVGKMLERERGKRMQNPKLVKKILEKIGAV